MSPSIGLFAGTRPTLRLGLVAGAIALSGCVADQGEVTALTTAASAFKAAASGGAPAAAARDDAGKARLIAFVARGQVPPVSACVPPLAAEQAFDADVARGADGAASWQALLKAPACGWGADLEPAAPGAPPAQPIIAALDDYYAAVAGIASAASVQQVVDATNKATGAIATLAGLVPAAAAPAKAASALVGKLVQYGLRAAQYQALKAVLGDVDPLLDPASGPIVAALRVQQGYWISQTSFFAGDGVTGLHDALAASGSAADHLAVLQLAQPILDDLAAQQQAVRADPGAAYLALVKAHHALFAGLQHDQGQLPAMLAAAQDIASGAQALAGAVKPAAKKD